MKKILTLVAFIGILGAANAQSTTKGTPVKEEAKKVEKVQGCAGHGDAKADGKSCCAGKASGKAEASVDGAKAACCSKMAKDGKSCDHAKADAGDEHGHAHGEAHEHGDMKAHVCTKACTEEAHAYACGEEGHSCSAACHAKK